MNIGIYRSQDQKIIYNSQFAEKIFQDFKHKHTIEYIKDNTIEACVEKIEKKDLVIIFSHGYDQGIFHRFLDDDGKELPNPEYLVGTRNKNLNIFSGKKVIAFSCMTALQDISGLGETVVSQHGCRVYFGFQNYINRELPADYKDILNIDDTGNFISSIYSNVFSESLNMALRNNISFKKFAQLIQYKLRSIIVTSLSEEYGNHISLNVHENGARLVMETANSIFVHGSDDIKFCS